MDKLLLSQVPLFSSVPPAELEVLVNDLTEIAYPAQAILFEEGDLGDRFYIVTEGEVGIVKAMDTPDERLIGVRGPGEFIGEMSLLSGDHLRTASARTIGPARLLELTKQDFDTLLHRVPTIAYDMLGVLSTRLRQAHDGTIRDLKEKNRKLEEAYANLKAAQEQIIQKHLLERELRQAREIQESMLPPVLPPLAGFDLAARMIPALMVGGDFFDAILLDVDHLALIIGDVSGKGMPAALFMALTCSLLRAEAMRGDTPEVVLQRVNRQLMGMNAKGMFVTILYGILNRITREFVYVRAGHEDPLILDGSGTALEISTGAGSVVGLRPNPALEPMTLVIPVGGTMILYTDGVTEARNSQGDFFGLEGLLAVAPGLLNQPAAELCNALIATLTDFHGDAPQADDITLIAVQAK